jgi:hypothetical protein
MFENNFYLYKTLKKYRWLEQPLKKINAYKITKK